MQVQKVIEQLGYTAKEARVYLAALSLGEAHISDIAARVKLPRSSTQAIVDKLHEDGLMNFYVQRRYKYWVAEDPKRLLANYERREEDMRAAIPTLSALRKKRSPKRERESEKSLGIFREVADASSLPVLITDSSASVVYVNGAWEQQFGYALEEVLGKNPRILQSGKTPREVYARMAAALKAGTMFQSDEVIDKKKSGELFNLLTTVIPLTRAGETFYIQILDDITTRKRAERIGARFMRAVMRERS